MWFGPGKYRDPISEQNSNCSKIWFVYIVSAVVTWCENHCMCSTGSNQLQLYLITISLSLSKRTNLSHAAQRCNFMFNMTKRMLDTIHPCTAHCSSQHSTTTSWWSLQNCFSHRNKGHLWDPTWTELSSSSKVPSTSQNNSLATSLSLLADRAHAHGNGPLWALLSTETSIEKT